MLIKKASFIKSAVYEKDYPESIGTEFAFVGKSNVGKSSLINSLTNNKKLAKTSKTPGRTRLLNFFLINERIQFVDLPGYGFAKVSDSEKEKWKRIIEDYLESDRKKVILMLLDIRRIPSQEDIELLKWLEYYNLRYEIVFTKCDKLSNNQRFKQLKKIKKKLVFDKEDVFFYSSLSKKGRYELSNYILKYK
ncbi:MAG: ribosome biogenesis GTP-binding protein YihA/YsxC [Fusobacteriota bacterium]